MCVDVLRQANAEDFVQRGDIGLHATAGEDDLVGELNDARDVARWDRVPEAEARVRSDDSVVGAGDSDDGTTVILVRLEAAADGAQFARHAVRVVGRLQDITGTRVVAKDKASRRRAWHSVWNALGRRVRI